jgi:heptose-I-phosphate ethanolaminephosphotransferase
LLAVDIVIHKGMTRAIIPSGFTKKIRPSVIAPSSRMLLVKNKEWLKAINTVALANAIPPGTPGMESDVYFDKAKDHFEVYHDSSAPSLLNLDTLFSIHHERNPEASIWLDFKNLDKENLLPSLKEVCRLRIKYHLAGRMIIESSSPENLRAFCDSGFFTSYYVPLFNPYLLPEDSLASILQDVAAKLEKYPASAVSGYYFQYPVLKKFFPKYPILTWSVHSFGVVPYAFSNQLKNDETVKVILYPFER